MTGRIEGQTEIQQSAHARLADEVAATLATDPDRGLSAAEAAHRLARYGPNKLERRKPTSWAGILIRQFKSVIVLLLASAMALSLVVGDLPEAVAILVVLAINTLIGFWTELRAVRSMEALARLASVATRVRRDGQAGIVDAEDLVPGDIVVLEAGDVVTADLRLVSAAGLEADESVLTGESAPIAKDTDRRPAGTLLADRCNMAFKGSSITRGSGSGIVVATGGATELGHISTLAQTAAPTVSPIERRLSRLGHRLVWLTLVMAGFAVLAGVLRGQPLTHMIETGIALAVAAVPEGLPVVATLCLARGMWRMAERNALIRTLSAVETLGATTVILTDKTGTLTENRMTVTEILLAEGSWIPGQSAEGPAALALRVAVLCNNAEFGADGAGVGDPMELALLRAAEGVDATACPELREYAFDPDRLMMATLNAAPEGRLLAVKGAPQRVLELCSQIAGPEGTAPLDAAARAALEARIAAAARRGFRLLALAERTGADPDEADPYRDLTLLGMVCLSDPVRADVPAALAACRRAGVRVKMVTGDHADTASEIARQAGLGSAAPVAVRGGEMGDLAALDAEARATLLKADIFAG